MNNTLLLLCKKILGKNPVETYVTRNRLCFKTAIEKTKKKKFLKWAKDKKVVHSFFSFRSKSKRQLWTYGTVLIIGPFNYPFNCWLSLLIGAIFCKKYHINF